MSTGNGHDTSPEELLLTEVGPIPWRRSPSPRSNSSWPSPSHRDRDGRHLEDGPFRPSSEDEANVRAGVTELDSGEGVGVTEEELRHWAETGEWPNHLG
jgi:hypothetical protein